MEDPPEPSPMPMLDIPPYLKGPMQQSLTLIRRQHAEIARLRSELDGRNGHQHNHHQVPTTSGSSSHDDEMHMLTMRTELLSVREEVRRRDEQLEYQEELLSSLHFELETVIREKKRLQEEKDRLEKKYKSARASNREFARILGDEGPACGLSESPTLYQRSLGRERNHSSSATSKEDSVRIEELKGRYESLEFELTRFQTENIFIKAELDREKSLAMSLQADLETNRKLVLDRDAEIAELKANLGNKDIRLKQAEESLSCTATELNLERARCDELILTMEENDIIFSQTKEAGLALELANQQMSEEMKCAEQTIVSQKAKLDAQGQDLVRTKRELQLLQQKLQPQQH